MKIEQVYNISLNTSEAWVLKKILGCITDVKKKEIGLSDNGIELMRTLWSLLPDEDDEECATEC